MSFGCVPVVTDVSVAREFITESENGYICKVGDFQRIADCIIELVLDRKKLEKYGVINCTPCQGHFELV